jgi:hypothetical protein
LDRAEVKAFDVTAGWINSSRLSSSGGPPDRNLGRTLRSRQPARLERPANAARAAAAGYRAIPVAGPGPQGSDPPAAMPRGADRRGRGPFRRRPLRRYIERVDRAPTSQCGVLEFWKINGGGATIMLLIGSKRFSYE